MSKMKEITGRPSVKQLEAALSRERRRQKFRRGFWSAIKALIVIAAIVTLTVTYLLPILYMEGSDMDPAIKDGEVIVFITAGSIRRGDIIAFNYGGQKCIKRVIAVPGDIVGIGDDGGISLNGEVLTEPYASGQNPGGPAQGLPREIQSGQYFVAGDDRQISIDSRYAEIGDISEAQVIGKALLRVWPPDRLGFIWPGFVW